MIHRVLLWMLGLTAILGGLRIMASLAPPLWVSSYRTAVENAAQDGRAVITVGHSHSRAIDFDALGFSGEHLFMSGADLFETRFLASAFLGALPEVRYVLTPISPWDPFRDRAVADPRGRREALVLGRAFGEKRGISGAPVLGTMSLLLPMSGEDLWDLFGGRENNTLGQEPVAAMPGRLDSHLDPESEAASEVGRLMAHVAYTREKKPDLPAEVLQEVIAMHRDLQARGVKLVLFLSPLPEVTLEALRRESSELDLDLLLVFDQFVGDLRKKGLCVLDPFSDSAFLEDLGLFTDFSHLNPGGAALFSSRLGHLLRAGAGGCLSGHPIPSDR